MTYELHRAQVHAQATEKDPRLTVQVVSYMDNILDPNALPRYPFFLKNSFFNFKLDTWVWVLCSDDFHIGYILGQSNIFSETSSDYPNLTSRISTINDAALAVGAGFNSFTDLYFMYVDDNLIEAVNSKTGTKISYNSTGSIFIHSSRGIFIKYGESRFELNDKEINLKATNIRLDGKVALGNGPQSKYVLASTNPGTSINLSNGSVVISSKEVTI
jgi:hypothetical protein